MTSLILRQLFVCFFLAAIPGRSAEAQSVFEWNGGNGSWVDPSKWSGGVFPDYNIDVDIVRIDGGKAGASRVDFTGHSLPGTPSSGVFYSFHADRLEISAGDELHVNDGGRLFIWNAGNEAPAPTEVVNAGRINISRVPRPNYAAGFMGFYDTTLSGGGEIIMGTGVHGGPEEASFFMGGYTAQSTRPLVNQDNLIHGRGLINGPLHNLAAGTLSADVNAAGVKLELAYYGFGQPDQYPNSFVPTATNQGRFEAKNGGTLKLTLARLLNVGGTLEALSGGTLLPDVFGASEPVPTNLSDPNREAIRARNRQRGLYGGLLRNNGGTVQLNEHNTYLNGTAPGGIQLAGTIGIKQASIVGHIFNTGALVLGPGDAVTTPPQFYDTLNIDADPDGDRVNDTPLILDGGGTIRLTGPGSYFTANLTPYPGVATGDVTVQNKNNVIEGQGLIFAAVNLHNLPPVFENNAMVSPGGRVSANVNGKELRIVGVSGANAPRQVTTNEGLLEARNGGILRLDTSTIFQGTTGVIQVDEASRLSLAGMTVQGGTVRNLTLNGAPNFAPAAPGTGVHLSSSGLLDGRPHNGQPQPVKLEGAFYLDDSAVLTGTITPVAAGQGRIVVPTATQLAMLGTATIANALDVRLDGGALQPLQSEAGHSLVNDASTIHGFGSMDVPLTNAATGLVSADAAAQTLSLGAPVSNAGLIRAEGSGTLEIASVATNTGDGQISAAGDGRVVIKPGGEVIGGILTRTSVDARLLTLGGLLDSVTIPAGTGNQSNPSLKVFGGVDLRNGLTNNGWIHADSPISLVGTVTLLGSGVLQLDGGNIQADSSVQTDKLFLNSEIRGHGKITAGVLNLEGAKIIGNVPTSSLELAAPDGVLSQNVGQIIGADGGQVVISGYVKQQRSGLLDGTIRTAGMQGSVRIDGTVEGGELWNFSPGGQIFMNGGTLVDVTLASDQPEALLFGTSTGKFQGTITNNAVIEMIDSSVSILGSVSLAGSGTLRMKQSFIAGEAGTLVLGGNQTLRGFGGVQTAFVNNGKVIADGFDIEGVELAFSQRPGGAGDYDIENKATLRFPSETSPPAGKYTVKGGTLAIDSPNAIGMNITLNGGTLSLGANLVGLNGSNIVALGGGNVIALGGGNLVGLNGSNIVALGGGNIVALGGGNLVGLNGSNIVALGGGNLVGLNGSNIIANGGGNLVGLNGSNIVALGGGNVADRRANPAAALLGSVPSTATIVAQNGGTITGDGTFRADNGVWAESGGTVAPGYPIGTITIDSSLNLLPGSTLAVDLAGPVAGTQHDRLTATGTVVIGGNLHVVVANGFTPTAGQSFEVLSANSVSGEFANLTFTGRRAFGVSYGPQSVTVTATSETIGTYDEWTASRFTPEEQADPAISGPTADPDRDGLGNKLEYFFGSEPRDAGSSAVVHEGIVDEGGQRFFTLTFPRAHGTNDVSYGVQRAAKLGDGWAQATFVVTSTIVSGDTDIITVKVQPAITTTPRQFYRITVD